MPLAEDAQRGANDIAEVLKEIQFASTSEVLLCASARGGPFVIADAKHLVAVRGKSRRGIRAVGLVGSRDVGAGGGHDLAVGPK